MPKKGSIKSKTYSKTKSKSPQRFLETVILFGIGVLLLFLVLVSGENIWLFIHNFIFGLFGVCAIFLPILLIFIAVLESLDKNISNLKLKIWMAIVTIVFACSLFFVFSSAFENSKNINWVKYVISQYKTGMLSKSSGLFGALIGAPMIWAFGTAGARITNVILLFILIMFITGTTLIELFRIFLKPAKIIRNKIEDRNAEIKNRKNIDIDVTEGKNTKFKIFGDMNGSEENEYKSDDADDISAVTEKFLNKINSENEDLKK